MSACATTFPATLNLSILIRRLAASIILAAALFGLHDAGVISGALAPPPGFEPAWVVRNLDVPQYLTWLNASRTSALLPDYHAPWNTEPALFEPLFWLAARFPFSPIAAYSVFHFLLYIAAAFVLLYACSVFCPGRETWFAFAMMVCAIPWRLYGWLLASMSGSIKWQALFAGGMIDYGYDTADGLLRGGLSNSPTLTVGTMSVLLAMALTARYLERPSRGVLAGLCATAFASAFLHPFEIFLIVPAAAIPLIVRRNFRACIALTISGCTGFAPYFVQSARSAWVRDAGEMIHSSFHPFWALADFGPPCLLAVYLLALRFRMPEPRDLVLKSWFITAPVLLIVPGVPFALHLLNGFAYCTAFLLVRRIAIDKQISPLLSRHRRLAYGMLAGIVALSVAAIASFEIQLWRDGRRAETMWLLNTVRPNAERELLDWLKHQTPPDALIVSPPDLAPWIATIPRPSFASHDFFSITYRSQRALLDKFLTGEIPAQDLVRQYGAQIFVVPSASPARISAVPRTTIGPWHVYQFPDAMMKPYPGLAVLEPDAPRSLRWRVLEWFGKRNAAR
jgi:hypothetical protein